MLNCTTPGVWVEEIPTLPPSVAQVATVPDEPPTMVEATRWLGALGGRLGRRRDGPPGSEVLWRARQRLDVAVKVYILFTGASPPANWRSYPPRLAAVRPSPPEPPAAADAGRARS